MKRRSLARLSLILAAASMLALSTGCGSDDDGGGSSPQAENEAAIEGAEKSSATESDVLAALGATKDDLARVARAGRGELIGAVPS